MPLGLHLAWMSMTVLRVVGVITVFAGVALFGAFFIGGNARSANGRIPASSWKGRGPKKAMRIVAMGALMLLAAFIISSFMPNGQ